MLFAFGQDLFAGSSNAEFRVHTTGTSGSRVCTIQWKNVKDKIQAGAAQLYDTINFQIKLYESRLLCTASTLNTLCSTQQKKQEKIEQI